MSQEVSVAPQGGETGHPVGRRGRRLSFVQSHSRLVLAAQRALRTRVTATGSDAVRYVCSQVDWDASFGFAMMRKDWSADATATWQASVAWIATLRDFCRSRGERFTVALLSGPQQHSEQTWALSMQVCSLRADDCERDEPNRLLRQIRPLVVPPSTSPLAWRMRHDPRWCRLSVSGLDTYAS